MDNPKNKGKITDELKGERMEYTGKYWRAFSKKYNKEVDILEYASKDKFPYCECSRCGKNIISKMYVVQDIEDQTEMEYLGSECIKHI